MDESCEGGTSDQQNNMEQTGLIKISHSNQNSDLYPDHSDDEIHVKLSKKHTEIFSDSESDTDKLSSSTPGKYNRNVLTTRQSVDNDNDTGFTSKTKKSRIQNISSDEENRVETNDTHMSDNNDSEHDDSTPIKQQRKSRIKAMSSSDEDTQHGSSLDHDTLLKPALKNVEQQARMINKKDKMKNKFKNLLSSVGRNSKVYQDENSLSKVASEQKSQDTNIDSSDGSEDQDMSNIKQKIKARNETLKSTLYDPDMSDKKNIHKKTNSGRKSMTGKQNNSNSSTSDGSGDEELKKIKQKIKERNESLKSNLYDPDTSDEDGNQRRNISKLVNKSTKAKQNDSNSSSSDGSGNEEINKIKQKIKERRKSLKSTICDPDTSDDDQVQIPNTSKSKNIRKSTKMISPLPVRMSAKQAMENMQKIKSESNRMLREKDVSLPYHRPKALSLKDIMSRRKPALSSDGKVLPIKMNDEQLRQYALHLEQRQKEMIELCKSDSEDEETSENVSKPNEGVTTDANCVSDEKLSAEVVENVEKCTVEDSDKSFDEMNLNLGSESKSTGINTDNDVEIIENIAEKQDNLKLTEGKKQEKSIELSSNKSHPDENEDIIENDTNALTADKEITEQCHERKATNAKVLAITVNTEPESQLISLHYDSEKIDSHGEIEEISAENVGKEVKIAEEQNETIERDIDMTVKNQACNNNKENNSEENIAVFEDNNDLFDNDDDIDMEAIDRLIENAEIINTTNSQYVNSPMLVREPPNLNSKPKLTGAPGMVIDLDGTDAAQPKKLSGVELLKERFCYFANLKTPEEMEKIKEKKIKPGTQHSKLKHELEEQMAEQRSLEWAKRLEADKQQRQEINALRGDESEEDEIEKIEAKLAETEADGEADESSSESEEEPEENDVIIKDKPFKNNALISGEAEESDCDETNDIGLPATENDEEYAENVDDSDEESSESSDDDDNENDAAKSKKGRILKAFEDSDDEDATEGTKGETKTQSVNEINVSEENDKNVANVFNLSNPITQDDELQSAQLQKSCSEDIFASQDTDVKLTNSTEKQNEIVEKTSNDKLCNEENSTNGNNLAVIIETQPYEDAKFDDIVGMCSGSFSQNIVNTQPQVTQPTQTQELGDDVLALCTGKFYDNQFISQEEDPKNNVENQLKDNNTTLREDEPNHILETPEAETKKADDGKLLKSILDELDGPDFQDPKPNKFFPANSNTENEDTAINQQKKRFVIDSDDEEKDSTQVVSKKKLKKRKLQDRALQISDDEEDVSEEENEYEDMSDTEENLERVVEYDSEENEVEVQQPIQAKKKKRKMGEFFENEAELTSEDEYVGSGDEDERGLDRMEREEGDDDTFHQGRLQAELGQIHMRDVLDQDKREVRLIQELLFEDGDLGDGHRQRQFRWRNADGEEEMGTGLDEFGETQEEEYESEEQWRKQRHEREVFLRSLVQKENEESESIHNVTITRTSIIKANLISRTMSSLLTEASSIEEKTSTGKEKSPTDQQKSDSAVVLEKKSTKDVPSPVKKPFSLMPQNYRGSLLSRGSGALARLAALATPLAGDSNDNAPKMNSLAPGKRSFVFSAVSPKTEDKPKVSKRKGDDHSASPQLMKKIKTNEKRGLVKTSLLDHLRT